MVRLVAVAQTAQDLDHLVDRRLLDAHLLEASLGAASARGTSGTRRASSRRWSGSSRRARSLGEDRRGVDRALGGAGADEIVELVDEQDDVAALLDLLHDLLQPLLELTPVLRARDERGEVERVDLLAMQKLGRSRGDPLREPSTTAVLPTPGSPIRTGLFFWRRERICA